MLLIYLDNTLRPSGELICRGIQQRPDIGYLSQLEPLRYLEVGGFYKTPKFPIWVVASSSHFTTMFGDAACLKESVSDVLLEKVRFLCVLGGLCHSTRGDLVCSLTPRLKRTDAESTLLGLLAPPLLLVGRHLVDLLHDDGPTLKAGRAI